MDSKPLALVYYFINLSVPTSVKVIWVIMTRGLSTSTPSHFYIDIRYPEMHILVCFYLYFSLSLMAILL